MKAPIKLFVLLLFPFFMSCAGIGSNMPLKLMRAESYYADANQIKFLQAVGRGNEENMKKYLELGADVNAIGKEQMHPLFWAISKGNLKGFEFLLANGSNPEIANVTSKDGKLTYTLYEIALTIDNGSYLSLLLKYGMSPDRPIAFAGNTVMRHAILHSRINQVRLLIEAGANLNHQNDSGQTPMLMAAGINKFDMVYLFLENGADPTIKDVWNYDLSGMIKLYADRGMDPRGEQYKGYLLVVDELKSRGLIESNWNPTLPVNQKAVDDLRKRGLLP